MSRIPEAASERRVTVWLVALSFAPVAPAAAATADLAIAGVTVIGAETGAAPPDRGIPAADPTVEIANTRAIEGLLRDGRYFSGERRAELRRLRSEE